MVWDVTDYKEFNKMASAAQGRIAQNLAMVCHLNPPDGFTRVSDWHRGFTPFSVINGHNSDVLSMLSSGDLPATFDDPPEYHVHAIIRGVAHAVSAAERASAAVGSAIVSALRNTSELRTLARGRTRQHRSFDAKVNERYNNCSWICD